MRVRPQRPRRQPGGPRRCPGLLAGPVAACGRRASLPGGVELVEVSTYGPDHGVRVTVQAPKMLFVTDRHDHAGR